MSNTRHIASTLFQDDHYLGRPADEDDRIVGRRIALLEQYPEFFQPGLSCVEVGCGNGATINRLAHRFVSCLGLDIYDYREAFEAQRRIHSASHTRFMQMDLERERPGEQFDRLISFEVIEHLRSEDSVRAYAEILRPGGLAAITVPNKWWIFETHGARLPLLPWNRVPFFSWLPRPLHERFANARIYTKKRICRLMERHGFRVLDVRYVTAPMDVLPPGRLKRWLQRTIFRKDSTRIPFLATSVFLIAQKTNQS